MDFEIDVNQIKIASSEENVSQTIEGLLTLNDLIPSHTDEEIMEITEKQFDKRKYNNKDSRGEENSITEKQIKERHEETPEEILEVQLEESPEESGGHRPEMWDKDDEKVRGHKNVSPLWHQVYKQEDERNKKEMKKELK